MQLHFKAEGSGFPMVILHGLFGMLDNWQSFAKQLYPSHLTHLLDLRNHGKSPHVPEMSYDLMADDVAETMEAQWMHDGAFVLGHSMGGKVAMQLAISQPHLVRALIVVDIAPVKYPGGHEDIIEALQNVPIDQVTSRQEVLDSLSSKIKEEPVRAFLMKNLTRTKAGTYQWKMNLPAIAASYPQLLDALPSDDETYTGPVLFVRGGQSNYITGESEKWIRKLFPGARLETIDGAGHWIHADQPGRLLKVVTDFLSNPS